MFHHIGNPIKELAVQISIDGQGPRLYRTPNGNVYPSITEVLKLLSEEHIEKWKRRVGLKVAKQESDYAIIRGNDLHEMAEVYLKNEIIDPKKYPLNTRIIFNQIKKYVNKINNIHTQETPLFSDYFKIAGRTDCIAEYEGILSVIDFKGSKKAKLRDYIVAYLMQTSFYAAAYFERTKIRIPQCVIIMGNEEGGAQVFKEEPKLWWKPLKELRLLWQSKHPNLTV